MSKDYKIGVVVGLVVLIAGVAYYTFFRTDEQPTPTETAEQANQRQIALAPVESAPTDIQDEEIIDLRGNPGGATDASTTGEPASDMWDLPSRPEPTETAPPTETGEEDVVTPRVASAGPAEAPSPGPTRWELDTDTEPTGETPSASTDETTEPAPTGGGFQIDPDADQAIRQPDPILRRVERPQPVELGSESTYVVQAGDLGFWYIAAKVYNGRGHLWTLIRDANPGIDTNALRAGMKLKIPPAPQPRRASDAPAAPPEQRGRVTQDPQTGQRVYVVSNDDEGGLWGIAQKVYGKGHLWPLIQKANLAKVPDPSRISVGMKLVIPPAPNENAPTAPTAAGATATANLRGRTYTREDKKFYVVASGDNGFWGVSKKVYGDGKYSALIREANPGVTSENLQPGDRLVVPPLPAEGTAPRPARPRSTRPATSPPPPGEPDFGP